MRGEHEAGVVRHVQPLVRVGRPRVGALDALHVMPQRAAGGGPQPERAVHVEPGLMPAGEIGDRVERIERAGVHVAGLRADDRRTTARAASAFASASRASCAPDRRRRRARPVARPTPSIRSAPTTDTCTSSPTMTRRRGAPCRPSASTSQPARRSSSCRAAASAVKFAMWQPVTKPTLACRRQPEQIDQPARRPPPRRPRRPAT